MTWLDLPGDAGAGTLALLLLAALTAGWVDAVVGGSGLVQLPALLLGLGPGTPALFSLGTNKIAGILGTITSAATYYRRVRPDLRTALPMAGFAVTGALVGAGVASVIPSQLFKPAVLVVLVGVLVYTVRRPSLGNVTVLRHAGRRHHVTAGLIGFVLGVYDGAVGPGTGSFLLFALVGLLGYGFVQASATAKIVNVATNLGALLVFVPQGVVLWKLGLLMGAANMLGAYVGARTAVARGSAFVRVVFVAISTALVVRLGVDVVDGLRNGHLG
ncbi:MAG TPA: sulfite exporter TauE/SafE family protein [Actinomycetales bacterium]|nr:sulfite exporter TauE/SafE family protein [Actinomycetales bacterium]